MGALPVGAGDPVGQVTEFTIPSPNSAPVEITVGPDGNLWFTEGKSPGRIGRITPSGAITEFSDNLTPDSAPNRIAAGPDGNLWFTEFDNPGRIGRITTTGAIDEFAIPSPNSGPLGIETGCDGNLWFVESANPGRIGRITTAGAIDEFAIPSPNSGPVGIAAGPDANLWFTQNSDPGRIANIGAGLCSPVRTAGTSHGRAPLYQLRSRPVAARLQAILRGCESSITSGPGSTASTPGMSIG